MTNFELFEYCKKNPEGFLDRNYMFVDKHKDLSLYISKTKNIKNKLIAIKEIIIKPNSNKVIDQLFNDLQNELNKYTNFSEFISFVNACDSRLEEVRNDIGLLKKTTLLYIKYRDLNDIVPSEWVQALIDKSTSRKKGQAGEIKLISILKKEGHHLVDNLTDFNKSKNCVTRFKNNGDFSNKSIKDTFEVKIGKKSQNKKLDLIIKKNQEIYFLEAKHLNTGGGGQNKQIKELIDVVNLKSDKYHFVAFLDGIHSNNILSADKDSSPKIKSQYKDILKCLRRNKNNYWINTAGFEKLFKYPLRPHPGGN